MFFWFCTAIALVVADFVLSCLAGWYLFRLPTFDMEPERKAA